MCHGQVRIVLDGKVLEKYIDALVRHLDMLSSHDRPIVDVKGGGIEECMRAVIDSLTLGCPYCHIAIGPDPDGCAAMRCTVCSQYFCLLCLSIEKDNSTCHAHVRACPQNPSKNVFATARIRRNAHRLLQVQAIQGVFQERYGPRWRQEPEVAKVMRGCGNVLKEVGVSKDCIFQETYDSHRQQKPAPLRMAGRLPPKDVRSTPRLIPRPNHNPAPVRPPKRGSTLNIHLSVCVGIAFIIALAYDLYNRWSCNTPEEVSIAIAGEAEVTEEDMMSVTKENSMASPISWMKYITGCLWEIFLYCGKGFCLTIVLSPTLRGLKRSVRDGVFILITLLWYPVWVAVKTSCSLLLTAAMSICVMLVAMITLNGPPEGQNRVWCYSLLTMFIIALMVAKYIICGVVFDNDILRCI